MSALNRLKAGLFRTRNELKGKLAGLFGGSSIDSSFWEELEARLIQSDLGVEVTLKIIEEMKKKPFTSSEEGLEILKRALENELDFPSPVLIEEDKLNLYLIVGVNGTGKTSTSIKIANFLRQAGYQPLLIAADTFRAAGSEQLEVLAQKYFFPVVSQQRGADPAAVVFDGVAKASSDKLKVAIADTAGRLHTKKDLMEELKKVKRAALKANPDLRIVVLLVIEATFGLNALSQARVFEEALSPDGLVLTKLDGTAKGGFVIAVQRELKKPIWFVSFGEKIEDFDLFNRKKFVEALLD